jgi:hypothetical protein
MSDLLASFGKPFAYQVAAYRLRLIQLAPTTAWDKEIWQAQHDRAFMVAGAMKADVLADLAAMVDKAIAQGGTLEQFRRDFRAMVEKKGWQISPAGQGTKGGEAWRTKVIYKTNMATSYAAGRLAQLRAGGYRFFVYRHGNSLEPRLQHLAWDGLVLPADHPFWDTHAPPNGWGCSCRIAGARSRESAHRVGGKPDKELPDNWQSIDPKTGAPVGLDRGWDYSPGASVADTVSVMAEKTVHWPYQVAKAYMQSLPSQTRDDLSKAYRQLQSTSDDLQRFIESIPVQGDLGSNSAIKTLGLLTEDQLSRLRHRLLVDARDYDFAIDASGIRHALKKHGEADFEAARGQIGISAPDFATLMQNLDGDFDIQEITPKGVIRQFQLEFVVGAKRFFAIFEIRAGRQRLTFATMWIKNENRPLPNTP